MYFTVSPDSVNKLKILSPDPGNAPAAESALSVFHITFQYEYGVSFDHDFPALRAIRMVAGMVRDIADIRVTYAAAHRGISEPLECGHGSLGKVEKLIIRVKTGEMNGNIRSDFTQDPV